eukprot:g5065.t1
MDVAQIRSISLELQAKDLKRQQKALKSLQGLVSKGNNISSVLPLVLELLDEKSLRSDAAAVLSAVVALPATREQCSDWDEVGGVLVGEDCIWLPNRDQAIELNKAAGLPPRQGHDSTLLVDLGRATRGGAARELRWGDLPPPPAELVAKLAECSAFRGKWGALFASARAQLVQMMMRFCHSADMMQCRDLVLTTAENLLQLGNDVFQQSYLRFFLSECLSSAISLWHVMGKQLKEGAALNSRACSICADALVMGAVMAPKTCATAPHLLRLMVMAAKVFVLRAGRGDVELLPAAVRKIGQEKMPALAVAALARACWMVKDLVELKALVEGIVQQHLLGLLLETADDSPIAQASAWLLISVAQVTGCQNALVDVFNRGELLGKSPAILLAAASLDTLGSLTQSSRSNMAEVLRQTDLPGQLCSLAPFAERLRAAPASGWRVFEEP